MRKIKLIGLFSLLSLGVFAQEQTEKLYLSGVDNENTVTWDFWCSVGRKSGEWTKIEVPAHWEQQGFGEYDYGRDYRTYGKKFRFQEEYGIYKHNFEVGADWDGKEIVIVFDGVMTDAEVKINGKLAGDVHQGAFYSFKYNISDKVKLGTNELEVKVSKVSANGSVNRAERYADFWIFGGIYRPVYLEVYPKTHIEHVTIDAKADGAFRADVFLQNVEAKKGKVQAVITDAQQRELASWETKLSASDEVLRIAQQVKGIQAWTAETPAQYILKLTLIDGNNKTHVLTQKFGFRTVEIHEGDGIYVNGTKVKFKGVNRHVWWPETGRCVNHAINLEDVKLIKQMNMNAVRCAHYPPDRDFLQICDSLGLYVMDELTGWQNAYDDQVGAKLVREMVLNDVNHPSIILWDNGNEGGTNKNLDDDFAIYDLSNRPVIHAHHKPGNDFNGVDCNHYETYYSSKDILAEGKIFMPTEFLHAQDDGGAAASMVDYWELFWNTPNAAGGFTWNLSDEGIVRTDLNNAIDVNRVNAPDGILGPHREKEGSFYAFREIYSPIKITLAELPADFDGKLAIENRYHFTNLKQCTFQWELVDFVRPEVRGHGHVVKESASVASPDVAPTKKGTLQLNLPNNYKKYDALYLRAVDPHGDEVFCWSWKTDGNRKDVLRIVAKSLSAEELKLQEELKAQGVEEDNILPIESQAGDKSGVSDEATVHEDANFVELSASGISVRFSKETGLIEQVSNSFGLDIPFTNGPVLVSGNADFKGFRTEKRGSSYALIANYSGDIESLEWLMYSTGWLELNYKYRVDGGQQFLGLSFDFPESDIISAKWLGDGDTHVWKNRTQGGVIDVYERLYNNVLPATNNWGEQFKGYYKDVSWMEFNTVYGKFTMVANEPNLYVRLFDFYGISGARNYPVLPTGNLSFLDGIPPIGTKLAMGIDTKAERLGPSGELNVMKQAKTRTLYFYFGYR